jgi:hypothetical protein
MKEKPSGTAEEALGQLPRVDLPAIDEGATFIPLNIVVVKGHAAVRKCAHQLSPPRVLVSAVLLDWKMHVSQDRLNGI